MLEYDNSAFYYFAITLLVIYIIPGTYYALAELFRSFGSGDEGSKARTKTERQKAEKLKKQTTGWQRLNNTTYITNLIIVSICWIIFLYLITLVINDGEVSRFDPYQILGIEQGTAANEIKKAYRKLSLRYHPDKNIGDKSAEEMFMKIAKAYEALTDEASKENYEKFGNPDGKQSLEVSIGLPRILLDNPKVVLVLYLIAMVIVIPSVVGMWYANSKQYGEKNIKYETYSAFYTLLQETHRIKNIPEVLAASAEFRLINTPKPTDNEPMGVLYGKMKNDKLMVKPKFDHPNILRGNLLLHAHLMRMTDNLNPVLLADLSEMLSRSFELSEGLIEISHQRKWLDTSIAVLRFLQCVVQGLWVNNHSLEQLPHFTDNEVKMVTKGPKPQAKTLGEYLKIPDSEKKGLSHLTEDQRVEVLQICSLIPHLSLTTKIFVEEEEDGQQEDEPDLSSPSSSSPQKELTEKDKRKRQKWLEAVQATPQPKGDQIFENDLVTIRVTVTRDNVTDNKCAPPVFAPLFPRTVHENWWIVLTDHVPEGASSQLANIHAFEKISDQTRSFSHELRFMAPNKPGTYRMDLQIISDCYMGLDELSIIEFEVLAAEGLPEYHVHPEDEDLDLEPTLFDIGMQATQEDSSDDEEEDDDEEKEEEFVVSKNNSNGRVVMLDEEDDEED